MREPALVPCFRLHDERHAFAMASLIDQPNCIYRLMEHLGQSSVKATEIYARRLKGEGAQRKETCDTAPFGSMLPASAAVRAA